MTLEWFNGLALILGWFAMALGGIALIVGFAGLVMDRVWRRIRDTHGLHQVVQAVRAHKAKSPAA